MKFELVKGSVLAQNTDKRTAEFKAEISAITMDENMAKAITGKTPEIGNVIRVSTMWPADKKGLAATKEDYEQYGECTAFFNVVRVS